MNRFIYSATPLLIIATLYSFDGNAPLSSYKLSYKQAVKYYKASEFSKAIPGLKYFIDNTLNESDEAVNTNRLAQCLAAEALESGNLNQFAQAHKLLLKEYKRYKNKNSSQFIAVACEGFGDTIMFCNFVQTLNTIRIIDGNIPITIHLEGGQGLLKSILERSIENTIFTTGQLNRSQNESIVPLINVVRPDLLFATPKTRYLKPRNDVVNYWREKIDPQVLNIATKWRSGNKPVLGGRMLYRDLPLKMIIDLALQVDPHAHLYLIQSPPHHNILLQSEFDQMTKEDQELNRYNVIPDEYRQYVTQVAKSNGTDPHGAFEDALALLSLCIYVGSDTVTAHMSGNVPGGKTIMIIPSRNEDGTSNRDWRWGQGDPELSKTVGETTIWYDSDTFRLFEVNPHNMQELAPVVALLKQWQN